MTIALRSGVIIPVLLMLPNVAWMLLPQQSASRVGSVPVTLTIAENILRGFALAVPCFLALHLTKRFSAVALAAMALALAIYYAAWIRFFIGGRSADLLSASLIGIRSPLAFAPILVLILSAYVLDSWWMLFVAVTFGALHVWASALKG